MPQPVPLQAVQRLTERNLSPAQKAAIGAVAINWADAEYAFGLCFSKLSGAELDAALMAIMNMTAKAKIDTIGAFGSSRLPAKLRPAFAGLIQRARTLSSRRNTLVHSQWIGQDAKQRAVCLQLFAKFDKVTVSYTAWTTTEIEKIAVDLQNLFKDLCDFLIANGFWDGKPFG